VDENVENPMDVVVNETGIDQVSVCSAESIHNATLKLTLIVYIVVINKAIAIDQYLLVLWVVNETSI